MAERWLQSANSHDDQFCNADDPGDSKLELISWDIHFYSQLWENLVNSLKTVNPMTESGSLSQDNFDGEIEISSEITAG